MTKFQRVEKITQRKVPKGGRAPERRSGTPIEEENSAERKHTRPAPINHRNKFFDRRESGQRKTERGAVSRYKRQGGGFGKKRGGRYYSCAQAGLNNGSGAGDDNSVKERGVTCELKRTSQRGRRSNDKFSKKRNEGG